MTDPLAWLDDARAERAAKGLERRLRPVRDGRALANFGSNDYLGLARDPRVVAAAREAAGRHGWGAGASPLVTGWTEEHEALSEALARFEEAEAVALFPTGFAANVGAIGSLVGREDVVYLDRLSHACLVDGARLSGATLRVFPHNDAARLDDLLTRGRGRFRRVLIVAEGVYGMDGDLAPIDALADVAERHGAMLMVDEAHGTGVFGPDGRGACSEFGACGRVPIRSGTLSKALGSVGGFVAGSRRLIEHLVNSARSLIFSTSLPPACAAAAREALRIAEAEPDRRARVRAAGRKLSEALRDAGFEVPAVAGPIVPVILGGAERAVEFARRLEAEGFLVPAIRPPTVPSGTSRLRISLRADMTDDEVEGLAEAMRRLAPAGTPV